MSVISVRLPDDLKEELERAGVEIGKVVRDDLARLALTLRATRKMETLAKYRKSAPRPVADIVRDARREH